MNHSHTAKQFAAQLFGNFFIDFDTFGKNVLDNFGITGRNQLIIPVNVSFDLLIMHHLF